jgi:predicted dehydrogenase
MMFKCAIVGVSGPRARGHADAYRFIKRGKLAAISARRQEKLDAFGDEFGVAARYTDYREMFEKEKPDLVHVNTPPTVRREVFQAAQAAGVPALIVEKPLAIQSEDYLAICEFAQHSTVKIAINHQLHFHPRRAFLQRLVADGKIGALRLIDASAGMNTAYQGTHMLQAIGAFNPLAAPISVFGQAAGALGLQENAKQHYAPNYTLACISYDNAVSALLRCGAGAPRVIDDPLTHKHKRIAVYGTRGYVHWTMWSWDMCVDGKSEAGVHNYADEDVLGQAAMTEAMFDWMLDDRQVHPLNLDAALRDVNTLLGIYMSAVQRALIVLPVQPQPHLLQTLRECLA